MKRSSPPAPRPTLQTLATIYEAISESQSIGPVLSYFSSSGSAAAGADGAPPPPSRPEPLQEEEDDDDDDKESFHDEEQGNNNAKPRAVVFDHDDNEALQPQQQPRSRRRKLFSARHGFTLAFVTAVVAAAVLLGFNGLLNNQSSDRDNQSGEVSTTSSSTAPPTVAPTTAVSSGGSSSADNNTASSEDETDSSSSSSTLAPTTPSSNDNNDNAGFTSTGNGGDTFALPGPTPAPTENNCPKPPDETNGNALEQQDQIMSKTVYKVAVEQKYGRRCNPTPQGQEDLFVDLQCPYKIELEDRFAFADCEKLNATAARCTVPEGIDAISDADNLLILMMRDISVACWGYKAEDRSLSANVPNRTATCWKEGSNQLSVTARVDDPANCATRAQRTCEEGHPASRDLPHGDECRSEHRACRAGNKGWCATTAQQVRLRLDPPQHDDCSVPVSETEIANGHGAEGDVCEVNGDCHSGVCFDSVCWSGPFCIDQACSVSAHCRSNFCENGTCRPYQGEDLDPGPFSLNNHHTHHHNVNGGGGEEDNLGKRQ